MFPLKKVEETIVMQAIDPSGDPVASALSSAGYDTTRLVSPVEGGALEVLVSVRYQKNGAAAQPAAPTQPVAVTASGDDQVTENQVRKIFAELHRIGEALGQAYMQGHFGTTNPKQLHKKAASQLIKWLISQPAKG